MIYLVQHGKSLPEAEDPEKGLSLPGREETERIAGVANSYGVVPAHIWHSGKKRASQTAAIFNSFLAPPGGVQAVEGMAPMDDVAAFASRLGGRDGIMLVGHLPFMERLAALLVTGTEANPVFKFQNSGIVCLMRNPERQRWVVKWSLMPHIG